MYHNVLRTLLETMWNVASPCRNSRAADGSLLRQNIWEDAPETSAPDKLLGAGRPEVRTVPSVNSVLVWHNNDPDSIAVRHLHSTHKLRAPQICITLATIYMENLRRSATLEPPRKSIELEDPGAHELGRGTGPLDILSPSTLTVRQMCVPQKPRKTRKMYFRMLKRAVDLILRQILQFRLPELKGYYTLHQ